MDAHDDSAKRHPNIQAIRSQTPNDGSGPIYREIVGCLEIRGSVRHADGLCWGSPSTNRSGAYWLRRPRSRLSPRPATSSNALNPAISPRWLAVLGSSRGAAGLWAVSFRATVWLLSNLGAVEETAAGA